MSPDEPIQETDAVFRITIDADGIREVERLPMRPSFRGAAKAGIDRDPVTGRAMAAYMFVPALDWAKAVLVLRVRPHLSPPFPSLDAGGR